MAALVWSCLFASAWLVGFAVKSAGVAAPLWAMLSPGALAAMGLAKKAAAARWWRKQGALFFGVAVLAACVALGYAGEAGLSLLGLLCGTTVSLWPFAFEKAKSATAAKK